MSRRSQRIRLYTLDFFGAKVNCRDLIQAIADYFPIAEWLVIRRVSKNLKNQIDKLRGRYAGTKIKEQLIKQYGIPEPLITLIEEVGGVFNGETLLECIYGKQPDLRHRDITITIPYMALSVIRAWFASDQNLLWYRTDFKRLDYTNACDKIIVYVFYRKQFYLTNRVIQIFCANFTAEEIERKEPKTIFRNWFDGKRLFIGFQHDVVNRTFAYGIPPVIAQCATCNEHVINTISHYETRGFKCRNFRSSKTATVYEGKRMKTQRYYINNGLVYCKLDNQDLLSWIWAIIRGRFKTDLEQFIKYCNEQLGFAFPDTYAVKLKELIRNRTTETKQVKVNSYNLEISDFSLTV